MTMIEKILERGFRQVSRENEFILEDWTIRLHGDILEAFNNPEKQPGIYYTAPIKRVDIDALLYDIEENINNLCTEE